MNSESFLAAGRRRQLHGDAAMAALVLLLGSFLAAMGSTLMQRWHSSSARQQSLSFEDQLGIVANTAGLIVVTWWALSFAIAVVAALLERRGRQRAAAAASRFSPAFMRRLALAAVGLQLLAAPLATAATPPAAPPASPGPGVTAHSVQAAVPAAWTPTADSAHPQVPVRADAPATASPAPSPAAARVSGRLGLDPQWKPQGPVVEPGPLAARHLRAPEAETAPTEVTVRAGDSLWSLAAAALGPFASDLEVAMEWPRFYQANRAVIGENPDLLVPGQVLVLPPGT